MSAKVKRKPIPLRDDRAQIELDLVTGKSIKALSRKYDIHEQSLYKWRAKLPPQLKAAYLSQYLAPGADLEQIKTVESEGLLKSLAMQRARLFLEQDRAIEDGNGQLVATLSNAIHRNLELVGRYLGEMQAHSTQTTISVLVSPEYLQLRNALIRALAPFPEARRAVAATLHEMESSVAQRTQPKTIDMTPALPAPSQTNEQG
jgi:transposase-like protein